MILEAEPSTSGNREDSASQVMEPESMVANANSQELQMMNTILSKQIKNAETERDMYAAKGLELEKKLQDTQKEIAINRLKYSECQQKLDNYIKMQNLNLLNQGSVESSTVQQESANISNVSSKNSQSNHESQSDSQPISEVDRMLSRVSRSAAESSYTPSVHSQESESIEEVNIAKPTLPWEIACRNLLQKLYKNKNSYYFREPVNEFEYPDYRKSVTAPISLTEIEENFKAGEYKSPVQFSKDVNLIFINSRKYNRNKKTLVYKQTTWLKKFYDEEIKQILSDWRTSKKSRDTPKRKIKGTNNDSDGDDDSQSRLKCRPKRRRILLSDDDEASTSKTRASEVNDETDEDEQPVCRRLRTSLRKTPTKTHYGESDYESDDGFIVFTDESDNQSETDPDSESDDDENLINQCEDDDFDYITMNGTGNETESERNEDENEKVSSFTSASDLSNFKHGDFVTVKGKVSRVFKTVKQRSNKKVQTFRLFKFLLKTKEGRKVECVAWEETADYCQSIIRLNQVIKLKNINVKFCKGQSYNGGEFDFQLVVYNATAILLE